MKIEVRIIRVAFCLGFALATVSVWFQSGASHLFFFMLACLVVFLVGLGLVMRGERRRAS